MPIHRRNSQSAIEAQSEDLDRVSVPSQESGVYSATRLSNLHELDEAFDGLDELEEVHDELEEVREPVLPPLAELEEAFDELADALPEVPSLMPGIHIDSLTSNPQRISKPLQPMVPDHYVDRISPMPTSLPRVRRPMPTFEMDLDVPTQRAPFQRTSSTANMAAVRPPPAAAPAPAASAVPGGRELESFEEENNLDIALDIKAPPTSHSVVTTISGLEMTPPASQQAATPVSSTQKAYDPRPGIVAFAGFGIPPEKLGAMPGYALRVLARKAVLRDDLRVARLRRIQDISLYEAALECADESAVTKGLALIATSVLGGVSAVVAAAAFLL